MTRLAGIHGSEMRMQLPSVPSAAVEVAHWHQPDQPLNGRRWFEDAIGASKQVAHWSGSEVITRRGQGGLRTQLE